MHITHTYIHIHITYSCIIFYYIIIYIKGNNKQQSINLTDNINIETFEQFDQQRQFSEADASACVQLLRILFCGR